MTKNQFAIALKDEEKNILIEAASKDSLSLTSFIRRAAILEARRINREVIIDRA